MWVFAFGARRCKVRGILILAIGMTTFRIRNIFFSEILIGILLLSSALFALLISNSSNFLIYTNFLSFDFLSILDSGHEILPKFTIHNFINDCLMSVFFLLIGLELKKEILFGTLSAKKNLILPIIAACGGVIMPILIFYFFNYEEKSNLRGFAIPAATDIAFAYGIISLFGQKIIKSLKVFLISLAIFDDIIAIFIIIVFYSKNIYCNYILLAMCVIAALYFLNLKKCNKLYSYLLLGVVLWFVVFKSGIHPSISGVVLAAFIPYQKNLLNNLVKYISLITNYFILPLFVFANSGVRIENFSLEIFNNKLVIGIICGLFLGKQIGIVMFSFLATKLKLANLPCDHKGQSSTWLEFYGVSVVAGVGFTMSFFIGSLAFLENKYNFDMIKIGILSGSFFSALVGSFAIYLSLKFKSSSK